MLDPIDVEGYAEGTTILIFTKFESTFNKSYTTLTLMIIEMCCNKGMWVNPAQRLIVSITRKRKYSVCWIIIYRWMKGSGT